jgi:hypothetical protein
VEISDVNLGLTSATFPDIFVNILDKNGWEGKGDVFDLLSV